MPKCKECGQIVEEEKNVLEAVRNSSVDIDEIRKSLGNKYVAEKTPNGVVISNAVEEEKNLSEELQELIDRERGMYNSAKEWEKGIVGNFVGCVDKHFKKKFDEARKE